MKTLTASACIVLIATISAPGIAASKHDGHGAMAPGMKMQGQAPTEVKMVEGLVKKVDTLRTVRCRTWEWIFP